jgi:hypothetical protein
MTFFGGEKTLHLVLEWLEHCHRNFSGPQVLSV